jgi:formate hydrogenlyase subunit 3/multisubunit Na+/H+ antiporter MnhD subunit
MIFQIFNYAKVAKFVFRNRFMLYAMVAIAVMCLFGGFYSGWKLQKILQTSANMKVIERDVNIREKQDEVDSISYDPDSFRNGILRKGRL